MLDIVLIRERPELVKAVLQNRNQDPAQVNTILALDVQRRELLQEVEALRSERNREPVLLRWTWLFQRVHQATYEAPDDPFR